MSKAYDRALEFLNEANDPLIPVIGGPFHGMYWTVECEELPSGYVLRADDDGALAFVHSTQGLDLLDPADRDDASGGDIALVVPVASDMDAALRYVHEVTDSHHTDEGGASELFD